VDSGPTGANNDLPRIRGSLLTVVASPDPVFVAVDLATGVDGRGQPVPATDQRAMLLRAVMSTPAARGIAGPPGSICFAFDDVDAALGVALSLRRLADVPIDLSGISIRTGMEIGSVRRERAAIAEVVGIARSGLPAEIRVGGALAALLAAEPPERMAIEAAHNSARGSRASVFRLLPASEVVANNLPGFSTRFVGRAPEIDQLKRGLRTDRVITISGPPGSGKSRLAAELADRVLGQFELGAWFVPLAPLSDAALVLSVVAQAMGLGVTGAVPPIDAVVAHVGSRNLLLVLDNFEHLADAAADVARLLDTLPGLRVVVTSQRAMRFPGEFELALAPLDVGGPGEELPSAAAELFRERAVFADPTFRSDARIDGEIEALCRRLDGLPLAIELAAARVKVLSTAMIGDRLVAEMDVDAGSATETTDTNDRHQSLNRTIDWSYNLLDSRSRDLFRRLSVFRGGFTLEAAAAIWDKPPTDALVVDALTSLRDASLIVRDDTAGAPRFSMLETLRRFAEARLADDGSSQRVAQGHAGYYAALVERLAPQIMGPGQAAALDALALEHDNIRASLAFLLVADPAGAGVRMASTIWRFWQMRGHLAEGRRAMADALAAAGPEAATGDLAAAHAAAGGLAYWLGDLAATERHYAEAVALRRRLGVDPGIADALFDLAFVFDPSLRPPPEDPERTREGIAIATEAHERYVAANHPPGVAKSEWLLGSIVASQDLEEATRLLQSSVARFRTLDDPFGLGWALHSFGLTLLRAGDAAGAGAAFEEALTLFAMVGDASATALLLDDFAEVAKAEGDLVRAARLKGAASGRREATEAEIAMVNAPWLHGRDAGHSVDPALLERAWVEGASFTQASAIAYALHPDAAPRATLGLRVAALGPLAVDRAGSPISDWGGPKAGNRHALGIFAFLLDRGERGVTKDEFVEVLWPDADVDQGDLNFHRTLGGLRSTLAPTSSTGAPGAVTYRNGRYRLGDDVVAWNDADEFQRRIASAADATDDDAAIRGLEGARALYRGDYLDDCPLYGDSEYVEERRRFLRGLLVDALVDLGRRYEGRAAHNIASARYRQALEASGGDCPSASAGLSRLGVTGA
jgi:predicted ATPase